MQLLSDVVLIGEVEVSAAQWDNRRLATPAALNHVGSHLLSALPAPWLLAPSYARSLLPCLPPRSSVRRPAAADVETLAGRETRLVRRQPRNQSSHLLRFSGPTKGDTLHHIVHLFLRELSEDGCIYYRG